MNNNTIDVKHFYFFISNVLLQLNAESDKEHLEQKAFIKK